MNCYEATRRIREEESRYGIRTPIIALTANSAEEGLQDAMEAGMELHLTKPIPKPRITQIICGCDEFDIFSSTIHELSAANSSPHQGLFPFLGCMSLVRQLEIMYDHNPRPWSFPCLQQLLDPRLDDPACRPKPKATSHSRIGPPKKIEDEAKKQMKMSKGDIKMMAPAAPKDDEEHPSAAKGGSFCGPCH
ncbi:Sensor protein gacS [Hordeum vulgare]|nr:Sensor protein gacS [Hordeum vulgare]